MANMVHRVVDEIAIALHTGINPSREEWDAWMDSVRVISAANLSVLAVTDGGGPNTVQRNAFVKYLDGARMRIAVVSDAFVVRGIVTALSWFTDGIRLFSPDAFESATSHLSAAPADVERLRAALKDMAPSLSAPVRAMRGA
jgi:hypothetical protein